MSQPQNRPVRSRAATRELWAERLRRFAGAGTSVAAFCRQEQISSHAFYYWKSKLGPQTHASGDDPQPRLLPVRLLDATPVEMLLPGGCVLRLSPGCDLAFVRSLVDTLGGAPC